MKLANKKALITGGTTGIGLATAELFLREGAKVAITGRNPETLAAAKVQLGPEVLVIPADAKSPEGAAAVAETLGREFGSLDVAFLNAGIGIFRPLAATTEEIFDDVFGVNLRGLYFQAQKLLPLFSKGGSLIFNTSLAGHKGFPGTSAYSATKAAVRSLARTLGAELIGQGLRVNAVSPGPISTPIYGKLGMDAEAVKAFEEQMAASNPMKRFGKPEEVATAVLFLASADSSYVNGVDLAVDGGAGEF
jgi:NAD(P)-dependent dehydrogenase (short-subunit alcohol dehydrogenase family)